MKTPKTGSRPVQWLAVLLLGMLGLVSPFSARAEIQLRTQVAPNAIIPDYGYGVVTNSVTIQGIGVITGTTVGVELDSAPGVAPMFLGDMIASLHYGLGLEGVRNATLFNFSDSDPGNEETSYSFSQSTSAFNGASLENNRWTLQVGDLGPENQGRLKSWNLAVRGTAATFGTIDPGAGGEISMTGGGTQEIGARANSTGTGESAVALRSDFGQTLVFSNGLSGQNFRKTGVGVVEIKGSSPSYAGQVDVEAGKLVVSGTLGSGSTLNVGSGATLGGSGTVGALQIARGGILGVGRSPGRMNAGNTTWSTGGKFVWEIDNFAGNDTDFLAGQGENWDYLNVTGILNIVTNPGAAKFIIDVVSLLARTSQEEESTQGAASTWDPLKGYSFAIATATGGIQINSASFSSYGSQSAFDSALNSLFEIRTASFANASDSAALWSISTASEGTTMLLNYGAGATAIPEPNSASLVLLGLGVAYLKRRRNSLV